MKHIISGLIFLIIILTYTLVNDYEPLFIYLAWCAGYFKDYFSLNEEQQ
jgi:hypothetical protein